MCLTCSDVIVQARFLLSKVNPSQTHNNMYAWGQVSVAPPPLPTNHHVTQLHTIMHTSHLAEANVWRLQCQSSGVWRPNPHRWRQSAGLHGPPEEVGRVQRCLNLPVLSASFLCVCCLQPTSHYSVFGWDSVIVQGQTTGSDITDHTALVKEVMVQQSAPSDFSLLIFLLLRKK